MGGKIKGYISGATLIVGIVAAIIIVWLIADRDEKKRKIIELSDRLEEDKFLTEEIKRKLLELFEHHSIEDEDVKNELTQITKLIEKHETKAVMSLAKVLENLFKRLYKDDVGLKAKLKNKKAVFADYIEHAKSEGLLSNEDYHHLCLIRHIRNDEAHVLDVSKKKIAIISSFICGFGVVAVVTKILRDRQKSQNN